jgi:serine/threonine protein kinase
MEDSEVSASAAGANSLGKYRLIAELGHGGMAEVFLAVVRGPAGFNKLVVIKQIRPQLAEDPEFLGMFLDEARLAARLSHPNVVQTNEVGQEGERYFISMEYLEGQPLNRILHRLQKTGGLALPLHVKILSDVLAGLHHAHDLADYDGTPLGVVHRDVTPHNVFVTYDGQVKVVDFGIAKALNSSSETRTGVLKGKVAYMAPEQARGERVDRRADIFSVGVMLWEAAIGRRLWKGVPDIAILQRLLSGGIPSPRSIKPEVPEELEAIILKALAHQRDDRYATALDLQTALDDYLEVRGDRVHTRDVGKAIMAAFEADRAKIKGIIDEQLRVKTAGRPSGLPIIDPPTASNSTRTGDLGTESDASSGKVESVGTASYTGPSALFASSASTSADGSRGRRGLLVAAALAGGAVLAAVVAFWQIGRTREPAPPVSVASPVVTAAVSPSGAPAILTVEISVAANPPEAKVFLDEKLLAGNPAKATMPKDGMAHQVRIVAEGYATKVDIITFERDRSMDIALVKDAAADKQAGHPLVAGPVVPTDDMTRTVVKRPQRTLDTANPYDK